MKPYLFHISLYDLASIGTLFPGLTLAFLLAFAKRVDQKANLFLSLALTVIVLKTGGLTPFFLPALGPLLYFYVRQLTCPLQRFRWKDTLHFYSLLVGFWMPAWLVLISVIIYLYLSHRLLEDFYRRLRPVLMDRPRFAFRQQARTLFLLGLFCVLSLFGDPFYLTVAVVVIAMAGEAMLKPDRVVQLTTPITDRSDARDKGRRLKEAVAANRLYDDPELTLTTLAVKLNIQSHDLSRIINMGLEKNFSDFINEFRVRDIARKMQDPAFDRVTLLGIAYESGFNSKTTFNRVFKEMTGKTPLEYKNNLKKEVPNDKLEPRLPIRPVILRSGSLPNWAPVPSKRNTMFRNYFKIAYRQFLKQKMYAAIKIGGFALGIAACLLIALYIRDDMDHDSMYPDADRIYRVLGDGTANTGWAWPAPMSKAIQRDFPEVAASGRMQPNLDIQLRPAGQVQNTYEKGFLYADQAFFDVLQLPMVLGDGQTALKEQLTMVISQTLADKYYHHQNPIGQVMYLDNDKAHPYRISGVMADIPATSHLHTINFILTLAGKEFWGGEANSWDSYNYFVYIKLKAGANVEAFEKKLNADLIKNYLQPEAVKGGTKDPEKEVNKTHFHLQPVKDIHLYSYDTPDGFPHGDMRFIWLFGAIAAFILVIACINFINLSTAKSTNRAKEVGLRKVVGSNRSSLINQFLIESMLYSLLSFILGLIIAWLLLPYFNSLASKSLAMPWGQWWLVPVILVAAIIVGGLAGLYPAFYLSRFRPALILKGVISNGSKSPVLRNSLVVFQFTASIVLIISTIVIYSQTHFILNHKVGFDKDQVMVLHGTNTLDEQNIKAFKNELAGNASVKAVSISDYLPIEGTRRNGNTFWIEGRTQLDPGVWGQYWQIDDWYLKTMGIKLVEGRNFSSEMADDTAGQTVIINQIMAQKLNLKNPVGKLITNGNAVRVIIGVVQDFNFESMRGNIAPIALHFGFSPSMMTIKFSGRDVQHTVAEVSALWKKFSPDQPIRYTFLDQEFAAMYVDVQRTGSIFTSFAVLAITIACLGLFALSAFMAEQRSKEIGVRKVLGASVQNITTLLSIDFVKLVLLAILIASPIAWWGMNKWLQEFAYKITISWWMFAAAGLCAILIALITVSFQSLKAALANPVNSLRSE